MRAARYHEHGGPDVLSVESVEKPEPGENDLLIKVGAASVNPVDALVREGRPTKQPPAFPLTTGSDYAGTVKEVGSNVDRFAVGDHVFGDGINKWSGYQGSFAEYAVVPASRTAYLPESVSFQEAAAVAHVSLTAWRSILDFGNLQLADTCLIHGGSGGVGHVAVQLAKLGGAWVTTTAGSDAARTRVSELGADVVFDYHRSDLEEVITDAGPADVILDHKIDRYLDLDIAVAAHEARIVSIGNSGRDVTFSMAPLARSKDVALYQIGASSHPDPCSVFEKVARLLDEGKLEVEIAKRYDLEEAADAHRALEEESFVGKLVVVP